MLEKGLSLPTGLNYDGTCGIAGQLLEEHRVSNWVRRSFPYVIVDEAQDLNEQRLSIVQGLASSGVSLIAADAFQCLDPKIDGSPALNWIEAEADLSRLTGSKRTNKEGILYAANALREGKALPWRGVGFEIKEISGFPLAAWAIAVEILNTKGKETVAVITPSRTGSFSNKALERVRSSPFSNPRMGPYDIPWETSAIDERKSVLSALKLPEQIGYKDAQSVLSRVEHPAIKHVSLWCQKMDALGAGSEISSAIISDRVSAAINLRLRMRLFRNRRRHIALTVHQAKNREFDRVVVLWPYEISGDGEHLRRILYNAITRARLRCLVLVQGGTKGKNRLLNAPFSMTAEAVAGEISRRASTQRRKIKSR